MEPLQKLMKMGWNIYVLHTYTRAYVYMCACEKIRRSAFVLCMFSLAVCKVTQSWVCSRHTPLLAVGFRTAHDRAHRALYFNSPSCEYIRGCDAVISMPAIALVS